MVRKSCFIVESAGFDSEAGTRGCVQQMVYSLIGWPLSCDDLIKLELHKLDAKLYCFYCNIQFCFSKDESR